MCFLNARMVYQCLISYDSVYINFAMLLITSTVSVCCNKNSPNLHVQPHELSQYLICVLLASLCGRICPRYFMCSLIEQWHNSQVLGFLRVTEILCARFSYIQAVLLVAVPVTVSRFLPFPSHSAS